MRRIGILLLLILLPFSSYAEKGLEKKTQPNHDDVLKEENLISKHSNQKFETMIQLNHSDTDPKIIFSPQGNFFATVVTQGHLVKIWNKQGFLLKNLDIKGWNAEVSSLAFDPTENILAVGSKYLGLRKNDTSKPMLKIELFTIKGKVLRTITIEKSQGFQLYDLHSISFSPDGKIISALIPTRASKKTSAGFWRIDGKYLRALKNVKIIHFNSNERTFFTGSDDGTVRLWDLEGNLIKTVGKYLGEKSSFIEKLIIFSRSGKYFAVEYDDRVEIYNRDGQLQGSITQQFEKLQKIAFNSQEDTIMTIGDIVKKVKEKDGKYSRYWELDAFFWTIDGKLIKIIDKLGGNFESIDHNLQYLVTTDALWNSDGTRLTYLIGNNNEAVRTAFFSPDGQSFITAFSEGHLRLWSRSGDLIKDIGSQGELIYQIAFSPDGNYFLALSRTGYIRLFSLDGRQLFRIKEQKNIRFAFSPDSRLLITGSEDSKARIWTTEGKLVKILNGHSGPINGIAFNPNGKSFVTISEDSTAKIWGRDGHLINTSIGHSAPVNDISFSSDGETFVTVSEDSTAKIWSKTGKLLNSIKRKLKNTENDGRDVVTMFNNGKTIAYKLVDTSSNMFERLQLWDIDGQYIRTTSVTSSLALAPDRKSFAVGKNKDLKLMNAQGKLLKTLKGHEDGITEVYYSPTG
ncbi:WD40 repeat domain-containing protein, partial [Desulfobacula sp.]|uniref:WD40 repeat domain-containing protein n=1 Tax=Desulfobacula sp. TaxID=2593537 RepID=UPI001EC50537|nr:WD40 repeat domain-containing protein [Desulfobacula sp.]